MKRVFGVKKDKEPPPSLNDASDRVLIYTILSFLCLYMYVYVCMFFTEFTCLSD